MSQAVASLEGQLPDQQSALAEELSRGQVDENPLSPVDEAKDKLGKLLNARPTEHDLVEKNIMKDSKVAPSLQAAQTELQKQQLGDKLGHALEHRPQPEELVQKSILTKDEAPDTGVPSAGNVNPPSIS